MKRFVFAMYVLSSSLVVRSSVYEDVFSGRYCVQAAVRMLRATYAHEGRVKYSRLVSDWRLPDLALSTNGLPVVVKPGVWEDEQGLLLYEGNELQLLMKVRARVCRSLDGAHAALEEHFDNMAAARVWSCSTNDIGDVVFSVSLPSQSRAVFRRNNVLVAVYSWMSSNNATNIARQIDASILRASGVEVE